MSHLLPIGALLLAFTGLSFADEGLPAAAQAYSTGDYEKARQLARGAEKSEPQKAWRLIGASSCFLKDRGAALDALSHLPGKPDIEFLRFACNKNSVEISDEDIVIWSSPARLQVTEAQSAYNEKRYGDARRLALQATQLDPKLSLAFRLLGAAACWTHDKRLAQRASEHLQPVDQEVIRAVCARTLGVHLKNPRVLQ